jgi:hypothetical protein
MLPHPRSCLSLAIAFVLGLALLPAQAQPQTAAAPVQTAPPPPPPKPKHGPTPPPIACPKRLTGVDAGQTESFAFWLRAQGPKDQVKVQFSCKLDRKRLIVGLVDTPPDRERRGAPKYSVHLLDLSLDPPPARLLRSNQLEGPVVIVRPGGGMSLVFGEVTIVKGLAYRGYRAIDVATGKVQTFFDLPMEPTGLGCVTGRAMGLERIWVSSEAALVDLGDGGPYGVAVLHEDSDCKAAKNEKLLDTFIAVPNGFEPFK